MEIIRPRCGVVGRLIRHSKHLPHNRYCQMVEVITKIGHLAAVSDSAPVSALWSGEAVSALGMAEKGMGVPPGGLCGRQRL